MECLESLNNKRNFLSGMQIYILTIARDHAHSHQTFLSKLRLLVKLTAILNELRIHKMTASCTYYSEPSDTVCSRYFIQFDSVATMPCILYMN